VFRHGKADSYQGRRERQSLGSQASGVNRRFIRADAALERLVQARRLLVAHRVGLRKTPAGKNLGFHAKLGTVSGSVKVVAPAAARRASISIVVL
jgi:hypothetical protein